MVQFCIVHKYVIELYPGKYDEYFMFYDTMSDHPIYFDGEFLFKNMEGFLLWARDNKELERYVGKIPEKFGNDPNVNA